MRTLSGLVAIAVELGCASGAVSEPSVVAVPPAAPRVDAFEPQPDVARDASIPEDAPSGKCDPQHLWDPTAGACRLYPGGGNGWAGCTLHAAPPRGEACFTGTHWKQGRCDCVCDDEQKVWDAASKSCR